MKINVLTSCTGEKAVIHHRMLSLVDFMRGASVVRAREQELQSCLRPAEQMYTGLQHYNLMRGVHAARQQGISVEVKVLSAGYGLIDGKRLIAPYNVTFNEMRPRDFRSWVSDLHIREQVADYLARKADVTLILLGDKYLEAADLANVDKLGAHTIAFCGKGSVSKFAREIHTIQFEQADTKRFGSNMIGLKGELAKRLLLRAPNIIGCTLDDLAPLEQNVAENNGQSMRLKMPSQGSLF